MHWGSLYTALASYLQAKSKFGRWLVRIDDLDSPRNVAGSSETILATLEKLGLQWDGAVAYQSERLDRYQSALKQLSHLGILYPCRCSRKNLKNYREKHPDKPKYPGFCRHLDLATDASHALRIKTSHQTVAFPDLLQGENSTCLHTTEGDFIILRKDQIIAYQLAVVIDDHDAGVTDIVRGYDLLDSTFKQIYLQHKLGLPTPWYCHIPIIVDKHGEKLSKQSCAKPVNCKSPNKVLYNLLIQLKQEPPQSLSDAPVTELLAWAISNWDILRLSHLATQEEINN